MASSRDSIGWMALQFPRVAGAAGSFIGALARSGKLTREGVTALLTGADALVKLAEHPDITPEMLAAIVRILANTLDQPNGSYQVRRFLELCAACSSPAEGSEEPVPQTEKLPRHLRSGGMHALLLYMEQRVGKEPGTWLDAVSGYITAEGKLPDVDSSHLG